MTLRLTHCARTTLENGCPCDLLHSRDAEFKILRACSWVFLTHGSLHARAQRFRTRLVSSSTMTGSMRYDAFMSYGHAADGKLAPSVQKGLHKLAKPLFKLRALHVWDVETGHQSLELFAHEGGATDAPSAPTTPSSFRSVFLADDNFTVVRSRAKELLTALKAWNQSARKYPTTTSQLRRLEKDGFSVISRLRRLGEAEQVMWTRIMTAALPKPESMDFVLDVVAHYKQIRFMYATGQFGIRCSEAHPPPAPSRTSRANSICQSSPDSRPAQFRALARALEGPRLRAGARLTSSWDAEPIVWHTRVQKLPKHPKVSPILGSAAHRGCERWKPQVAQVWLAGSYGEGLR